MRTFRGPQVCHLTGVTYRQLDYWARRGMLRPSAVEASGSGSQRLYSETDVVKISVIHQLLEAGVTLRLCPSGLFCLGRRDGLRGSPSSSSEIGRSGDLPKRHRTHGPWPEWLCPQYRLSFGNPQCL